MRLAKPANDIEQCNKKVRTIEEWSKEFNVTILDPDGFDRTDRHLYDRHFTKDEFERGLCLSTIYMKANHV